MGPSLKFKENVLRADKKKNDDNLSMIFKKDKNIVFNPEKGRSKSIPTINMNYRIEALKDLKEDLIMRKDKVGNEIDQDEY